MSVAEPVREERWEMGITRAEFVRLLPAAVGGTPFEALAGGFHGESPGVRWRLWLDQAHERRVALLSLPILRVALRVEGESAAAERFVKRFLLGFQRAGG